MSPPTVVENSAAKLARHVVGRLRTEGFRAYLVGGCVRDLLLGGAPKDYDIATSARPEQVLRMYPKAQQVGAHFGVVLVRDMEAQVEVATFRSDHDYFDGRHPAYVRFEDDPKEDVLRRDFTVNALLLDPTSGEVLDYVGGRTDLQAGLIRAIGDAAQRFAEDHLRMLRAVRFSARLNFAIHPETEAAVRRLSSEIRSVSAERLRDELIRILTEGGARRGMEMLDRTGLLAVLLPEVAAMKGVEQPPQFHPEGDVWTHTLLMLEALPPGVEPVLAIGVLLHDVGKPPTFRIAERIRFDGHVEAGVQIAHDILSRLRFSKDDVERIEALVANHMRFADVPRMRESTLKRFLRLPHFHEHLELHRLDCTFSNENLTIYEQVKDKIEELGTAQIAPPRLLTGKDLIAAGYPPGPGFGPVLNAVEDAQLEGKVSTREDALKLARQLIRPASEPAST